MSNELREAVSIPRWLFALFVIPIITLVFMSGSQYQKIEYIAKTVEKFDTAMGRIPALEQRVAALERVIYRRSQ